MSTVLDRVRAKAQALAEAGAESKGFYPTTLKRFHKANGDVVVPNEEGVFIPKDEEELEILSWHVEQGRVSLTDPALMIETPAE